MKEKYIEYFMKVAEETANLSKCQRLKVGSVIVKDNRIISCGYNGLPSGWEPDECETNIVLTPEQYFSLPQEEKSRYKLDYGWVQRDDGMRYPGEIYKGLKTKDETIHSEANAISRLAASTESGVGADLFCTHLPCVQCAKIIYGAGIKRVFYRNLYRCTDGLDFLVKCGIEVNNI